MTNLAITTQSAVLAAKSITAGFHAAGYDSGIEYLNVNDISLQQVARQFWSQHRAETNTAMLALDSTLSKAEAEYRSQHPEQAGDTLAFYLHAAQHDRDMYTKACLQTVYSTIGYTISTALAHIADPHTYGVMQTMCQQYMHGTGSKLSITVTGLKVFAVSSAAEQAAMTLAVKHDDKIDRQHESRVFLASYVDAIILADMRKELKACGHDRCDTKSVLLSVYGAYRTQCRKIWNDIFPDNSEAPGPYAADIIPIRRKREPVQALS